MAPQTGMSLQSRSPNGRVPDLVIAAVTDDSDTVDANNPLGDRHSHSI